MTDNVFLKVAITGRETLGRDCNACAYWKRITTMDGDPPPPWVGQCRRHAPVPLALPNAKPLESPWPSTYSDDWCGEFAAIGVDPGWERPE